MLRQSVFGRLAGVQDVNPADRLGRDPAMCWIAGGRAATKQAASASRMGRFDGLRMIRTLPRSPISAGNELTRCTAAVR